MARLFYLKNPQTLQEFQELVTLVRALSDIGRTFTYVAPKAVAVRGTGEQMALAEWLFTELDKPRPVVAEVGLARQYHMRGDADNVVRVFYLNHAATPERLQEIAVYTRNATRIGRIFNYNSSRAIALRGTAAQVALADQLIAERDK